MDGYSTKYGKFIDFSMPIWKKTTTKLQHRATLPGSLTAEVRRGFGITTSVAQGFQS